MLNSIFMNDYSNIIVPVNLVSGILLVEKTSLFRKINPVGVVLILTATLLLYYQLEGRFDWEPKNCIPFIILPFSYLLGIFGEMKEDKRVLYVSNLLFFLSVFSISMFVTEGDLSQVKNQKIIICSIILSVIVSFFLPKYRKTGDIFSFTLSSLIIFSFLFVNSLLERDQSDLKKNLDKNVKTRDYK